MNGTFNGIPLSQIISVQVASHRIGFVRTSFRVIGELLPPLEQQLQLHAPAVLILPSHEIEGTIVHYTADVHSGYDITIESRSDSPSAFSRN
jgi:hypothetical protein